MTHSESNTQRAAALIEPIANPLATMKEIMEAGEAVVAAHKQLLAASDALAELIQYDRAFVLRRVLPQAAQERRNANKVLDFLETEYDAIERHLQRVAEERAEVAARQALLARLNLSGAEKALLGLNR